MSRSHTAIRLAWEAKTNSSEVSYHVVTNIWRRESKMLLILPLSSNSSPGTNLSESEEVKQTRSSGSAVQSGESATRAHPGD